MLIRILFFLTLLFCSPAFTSLRADWQPLPAGNPYVITIVSDSSGQKLLTSLDGAGLWLTENGGISWLPGNALLDPEDRVVVWDLWAADAAADTMVGLFFIPSEATSYYYRSCDGGNTWPIMLGIASPSVFTILPRRHNIWFWYNSPALQRSVDYGSSWTQCPSISMCYPQNLVPDMAHDSTLFCGTYLDGSQSAGVFRSDDLGQSWTRILDCGAQFGIVSGRVADVARLSNGELVAIVEAWNPEWTGENLVLSTDDGQTWQRIVNSPAATGDGRFVECPAHPGRLFMSAQCPGGIMRSDDFGRTWSVAAGGLPAIESAPRGLRWNTFSGEMFVLYDLAGVFHSRNCGDSWQSLGLPPVGQSHAGLYAAPEAVFTLAGGYGAYGSVGRLWELESPFTAWRQLAIPQVGGDSSLYFGPVFEKRGDTLLALAWIVDAANTQLVRSIDDGLTWQAIATLPYEMEVYETRVFRSDSLVRIIVPIGYYWDSLAVTEDLGDSWQVIPRNEMSGWWLRQIEQSGQAIYALTSDWDEGVCELWRTTNRGITWDTLHLPFDYCADFTLLGDEIFASEISDHVIWHWQNGLWDQRGAIGTAPYYDLQLLSIEGENPLLLALSGEPDSLWLSADSGYTWTARYCEYPFADQNEAVGTAIVDPYRQRLWISLGIGICYFDLAELSSDGPLRFKPADYTLLSVYPNPFNSEARIRFDLDRAARVTLRVYDLTGRLVKTLLDEVQGAGRHELTFDGASLASGTYFVHLRTDRLQRTQKMLMLK